MSSLFQAEAVIDDFRRACSVKGIVPVAGHVNRVDRGDVFARFCFVMLLSHCGEYMANGLTNAVRREFVMIANDRQTFVSVRKHSRSFLWCFECYAGLTRANVWRMGLRMPFAINSQ